METTTYVWIFNLSLFWHSRIGYHSRALHIQKAMGRWSVCCFFPSLSFFERCSIQNLCGVHMDSDEEAAFIQKLHGLQLRLTARLDLKHCQEEAPWSLRVTWCLCDARPNLKCISKARYQGGVLERRERRVKETYCLLRPLYLIRSLSNPEGIRAGNDIYIYC